jgi:esterase/lipase superfamily enzyme
VKASSGSELAREEDTGETLNRFLWGSSMPRLSSSSLRSLKYSTKEAGIFVVEEEEEEEEEEEVEQIEELRFL